MTCRLSGERSLPFGLLVSTSDIKTRHMVENETQFMKHIRITYPYNVYPLVPHFYIVNMAFSGGIHNFLTFVLKHKLSVHVRSASFRRF